jgi:hypothetical protein
MSEASFLEFGGARYDPAPDPSILGGVTGLSVEGSGSPSIGLVRLPGVPGSGVPGTLGSPGLGASIAASTSSLSPSVGTLGAPPPFTLLPPCSGADMRRQFGRSRFIRKSTHEIQLMRVPEAEYATRCMPGRDR